MKSKLILIALFLFIVPLVLALGNTFIFKTTDGNITMNTSLITGTNISCSDITGATSDLCTITGGAGGGLDGNASSICAGDQVLLGNGTCQTSLDFFDGSGINYTERTTNAYNVTWTQWAGMESYNATQSEVSNSLFNIKESWLSTLFDSLFGAKSTSDLSEGTNKYDNVSWNKTYADTLYASAGAGNSSWNQSFANTLYADISSEGNASWNQSLATTLYSDIQWAYNQTTATYTLYDSRWYQVLWDTTFNNSLDDRVGAKYNQTDLVLSVNTTNNINNLLSYSINKSNYWDTLNTYNATQMEQSGSTLNILVSWFTTQFNALFSGKTTDDLSEGTNKYDNVSWNKTYADTLYADISSEGNMSWNQSLATTLYAGITWAHNETTATYTLYDSRWLDDTTIGNCSADGSCGLITYDSELSYTTIWDTTFNTSFDDRDKDTQDLSYDAGTDVISLVDGGSIDITEVDTNTQLSEDNVEAYIFDNDNTDNLNMSNYNVTSVDCIHFKNGAKVCGV